MVGKNKRWGFLTGWDRSNFVSLLLNMQAQQVHNNMYTLFEDKETPNHYCRLDICDKELPRKIGIDNLTEDHKNQLEDLAQKSFNENLKQLEEIIL